MTNTFLFAVCEELTVKRTHIIFLSTGFAVGGDALVALVVKLVSAGHAVAGGAGVGAGGPGWGSGDTAGAALQPRRFFLQFLIPSASFGRCRAAAV